MTSGIRVYPADAVRAGNCMTGSREWAKAHGLDFRTFMREGLPVEDLRALECPLADRACDAAEARAASEAAE